MALSYFVVPLCLISASLIGYSQCKDSDTLTPFGTKVRSLISDDTFTKIFTVKSGSSKKEDEAIEKGEADFFKILGIPYDKSIVEGLEKESKKFKNRNLPTEQLFQAQTNTISKFLSDKGILKASNVDDIAQKYADELNKAVKSENGDDTDAEVDAIATEVGKFFKSVGVVISKESIEQFNKDYLQELDKYQNKGGGLLSGLRGVGGLLGGILVQN